MNYTPLPQAARREEMSANQKVKCPFCSTWQQTAKTGESDYSFVSHDSGGLLCQGSISFAIKAMVYPSTVDQQMALAQAALLALAALRDSEWSTDPSDDEPYCGICESWQHQGHERGCKLRAAIAALEAAGVMGG